MKSNEIYEEVTNKIVAALRDGVIPWDREFTVEGGLHRSFSTHKAYRGGNQFYLDLIAKSQGYKSPFWITMNQIKKNDGKLIKINKPEEKGTGQKSSIIFFFKMFEKKENGKVVTDKNGKPVLIPFLKSDRVFNLDQVEGIDAPDLPASKYSPEERASSIIEGIPNGPFIDYSDDHVGIATYDGAEDQVNLHSTHNGLPRFYRESFRGLVLSTSHSKRLNRTPEYGEDPEFSKERLIGEMGASMLVGLSGLKVPPREVQQRHLDGWIAALTEKPRLVVQAASKAQGACDYIVPEEEGE